MTFSPGLRPGRQHPKNEVSLTGPLNIAFINREDHHADSPYLAAAINRTLMLPKKPIYVNYLYY
jgi:hypothetical protein